MERISDVGIDGSIAFSNVVIYHRVIYTLRNINIDKEALTLMSCSQSNRRD